MIFTFIFGAFVGGVVGFTIAALVSLSSKEQEQADKEDLNS